MRFTKIPNSPKSVAPLAVLVVAALLRLIAPEQTPLHNDEGVNGFFLMRLFHDGYYQYDPANYHGPTLYYLALPLVYLFGLNTPTIRLEPALFGLLTIGGLLLLSPRIGKCGALTAAALLSVSPGAVYFSRYFIHETLLVAFTLGIVLSGLRYSDTGKPQYLLTMAVTAALLFATKETAIITAVVLVLAVVGAYLWLWLRGRHQPGKFHRLRTLGAWMPTVVSLFLIVAALFYSSFRTHAEGVADALRAFSIWSGTSTTTQAHPWNQYILWLWQGDPVLLILGVSGAVLALWRERRAFPVFCALWALGLLAAYSLVSYKTPWIALNFLLPLSLNAGCLAQSVYASLQKHGKERFLAAVTAACALVAISLFQAIQLCFYRYDDPQEAYVYVHTQRTFLALVSEVNRLGRAAGTGDNTSILVTSPYYWPLPWYLKNDHQVGYVGQVAPATANQELVIGSAEQASALDAVLGSKYHQVGSYPLWPGATLVLYARAGLARF